MEETENLIPIDHIPVAPPRPGTPGEGIYLQMWRDYLAAKPSRLSYILGDITSHPTQRDATVCASFMVFMGCNGGRALSQTADATTGMTKREAYLFTWARQNQRRAGVNHGIRTIEYMLAPVHPIDSEGMSKGRVNWEKVPDLTMRDIDVVDAMVEWWADHDGVEMRAIAEPMIQAAERRMWSELFKRDGNHEGPVI